MADKRKKNSDKVIEALQKGPITPDQMCEIMGDQYVGKMLSFLRHYGYEFSMTKEKSKIVLITMTKEGKLPVIEPRAPKKVEEKKQPGPRKVNRAFNSFTPRPAVAVNTKRDMDDFTIDPDFDNTTIEHVFNSFRG